MAEKINCDLCTTMALDMFSGVHYCPKLNCGCNLEESNFIPKVGQPLPRRLPELGEDKCPGMDKYVVQTY